MKKFSKIRIAVAGAAIGVTTTAISLVGAAGPAQASLSQCKVGYFCMWENADYTGKFVMMGTGSADFSKDFPTFNDRASAVRNLTTEDVSIHTDAQYKGRCSTIGSTVTRPLAGTANNSISSVRTYHHC